MTDSDTTGQAGAPRPALNPGDALLGEAINFDRVTALSAFMLRSPDGQPLVTLDLTTGEMTYGPGYTPDTAAEAFWDAVDTMGLEPVRVDTAARAAKARAWALVAQWRGEAVARREDPYADPHAQALAAALVGDAAAVAEPADCGRSITDFGPPARSAAREDPRYPAVLEQVAKMAWPAGNPMVPGGWAETLAGDVMAAIRRQEGQHRLIADHTYEGPGPCQATYFGAGACGYPRAEHALVEDDDSDGATDSVAG
ncbi:hypothetical protein [Streptomyces hydrogenans]|uniref:hypothetical protein n=1 Tax=Streptomyces hydrogenans TaxID=1873719 RepID=UPI0036E9EACC